MSYYNNMLDIKTLVLGEMATNCYIVIDEDSREAIVIDPADSGETILDVILAEQLSLKAVILTHGHFDHLLGLLSIYLSFPNVPVFLHPDDIFLYNRAAESAKHWLGHQVDPLPPTEILTPLSEKTLVNLGSSQFSFLELPGHTPGSVAILGPNWAVSGDVAFAEGGIGRTDFKYASPMQLSESLQKLKKLPDNWTIFPGHGESFYVSEFRDLIAQGDENQYSSLHATSL